MMTDGRLVRIPRRLRPRFTDMCLADQLFVDMYYALTAFEEEYGELSPVEVWSEALGVAKRLGSSPRPDISIHGECGEMLLRYASFVDGGMEVTRTEDDARRTRMMVLVTVLYMLTSASRRAPDTPGREVCVEIMKVVMPHPQYRRLCEQVRQGEAGEELKGHFVPHSDYVHPDARISDMLDGDTCGEKVECVDEIIDETLSTRNPDCYLLVIHVLSQYNDHHGYAFQPGIDRLREELHRLNAQRSEPRTVNNNGVYNELVNEQVNRTERQELTLFPNNNGFRQPKISNR